MMSELRTERDERTWAAFLRPALLLAVVAIAILALTRFKQVQLARTAAGSGKPLVRRYGTMNLALQQAFDSDDPAQVRSVLRRISRRDAPRDAVEVLAFDKTSRSLDVVLDSGWSANGHLNDGAPLVNALAAGQRRAAHVLLDHNANPNLSPERMPQALCMAILQDTRTATMTQLMLDHGASVKPTPGLAAYHQNNPVLAACRAGNVAALKLLLKRGASLRETGDRNVPLYFGVASDYPVATVGFLLDCGYSVDSTIPWSEWLGGRRWRRIKAPIVFAAAALGDPKLTRMLLERGANPLARASNGKSALDVATGACLEELKGASIRKAEPAMSYNKPHENGIRTRAE